MYLPESEHLNIASLSRLFDNKSECYKLFWFQAILNYICKNRNDINYEELIDEMIADAWYMVTEYHLNLGPNDTVETVVNYISDNYKLPSSIKKDEILKWLGSCEDKVIINIKRKLIKYVPCRLQAPFIKGLSESSWKKIETSPEILNGYEGLIYYYDISKKKLESRIRISKEWAEYVKENQEILRGWIKYNMITYLQKRNPSVPGISDKLYPPLERNLENVKKLWKKIKDLL